MIYLAFTPLMPKADLAYFSKTIDAEIFKAKIIEAHAAEDLRTSLFVKGTAEASIINLSYAHEATGVDLQPILQQDTEGWHNPEDDVIQAGDTLLLMLIKKADLFMAFVDKKTRLDNFEFREIYCGDPKTTWTLEYEEK